MDPNHIFIFYLNGMLRSNLLNRMILTVYTSVISVHIIEHILITFNIRV